MSVDERFHGKPPAGLANCSVAKGYSGCLQTFITLYVYWTHNFGQVECDCVGDFIFVRWMIFSWVTSLLNIQSISKQWKMILFEEKALHLLLSQAFDFLLFYSGTHRDSPENFTLQGAGTAVIGKCRHIIRQ